MVNSISDEEKLIFNNNLRQNLKYLRSYTDPGVFLTILGL